MSERPVKPDESECCGSGCKPCIFDVYEENLKKWEMKREGFLESKALNQVKYLPFILTAINGDGSLKEFRFQAVILKHDNQSGVLIKQTKAGLDYEVINEFLNIKAGQYLIMKGSFDSNTISRSYTPILDKEEFESGAFTAIISLQTKGKMSQFLSKLEINDVVFWRGPYQEFNYSPNSFKRVLLIGGGTGMVPLYNISKSIVEDDKDDTLVHAAGSFSCSDNIILRREFAKLLDFWNFSMNIYLSGGNECDFKPKYKEKVIFKRIDESVIREEVGGYGEGCLVIVCGPELFNTFIKESLVKVGVKDKNIFIFWYV